MSLLRKSLLFAVLWLTPTALAQPSGELVIYSGRSEPLIVPVIQLFQQQTGIRVTLQSGTATALANLILQEQPTPRADIFIANDAGTLEFLKLKDALQPYLSEQIRKISESFRARDGSWIGVSGRSRVLMYNTRLLRSEELPKSVLELTDPKWKNKLSMATTRNESVIAWVTALRLTKGDAFTKEYLLKLKANGIVTLNGHTDVRRAVGRGEFAVGLINHYYYHLELRDGSPVGVIYPDQGPNDMGVLVNVAGAAMVKNARRAREAQRFLEFLASPEAQKLFAEVNFEYPLLPGVPTAPGVRPLETIKLMPIRLDELG
ncbi:MAG: extracellular solute-binding protein, partial [Candidatus Bipolaricaulota bacterium]|nr:extracellular solute-binding protein [Candidatus Bipolaricaulota bacterium]